MFALDHRGHGRSEGLPAYIPDFDTLVLDFADYAKHVAALHPGAPLFVLGQSMGGALAFSSMTNAAITLNACL